MMIQYLFGGVRLIESSAALERVQKKVYPKRKARNVAHLRRMNNKWRKRYGFVYKPTVYQLGDTFCVHPSLMPLLKSRLL